jgi:hypothetical protein
MSRGRDGSEIVAEGGVDLAGDVALEAADGFTGRLAFTRAPNATVVPPGAVEPKRDELS